MRAHEILTERRMAPLYHYMDFEKTENVLTHDAMPANWEHEIPGVGKVKGNSFSRNKSFKFSSRPVRLIVDQAKLAQRHKIIPLDGEYIFRLPTNPATTMSDRKHNTQPGLSPLAEEFVRGPINSLHSYLIGIELGEPNFHYLSGANCFRLHDLAVEYCQKFSIPLSIDPKYLENMEAIKQRWAEYEEEDSLEEGAGPPNRYYHVTFNSKVNQIMRDGIQPGKKRIWNNALGGTLGKKDAVYLFNDLTMAVRWAHKMEYEFSKKASILVVDNPPGNIVADDHIEAQMNGRSWFHTDSVVPPSCIKQVIPMSVHLSRQVVQNGKVDLEESTEEPRLVEGPYVGGRVLPRMADGSIPQTVYRIMSAEEFRAGMESGTFHGRPTIHAAARPYFEYCEPGGDNVLVAIEYHDGDGWRAKQTHGMGVVAITDDLPADRVKMVAKGTRSEIER